MKIVCLGAGIEYSLGPFALEARRRGFDVIEIDMHCLGWRSLMSQTAPGQFILVTSYHPFVDSWRHTKEFGTDLDIAALPEFIAKYQPSRVYFIPHDLTEPFKDTELGALAFFDALFMPNESSWYLREYARVEVVGWIKFATGTALPMRDFSFLPSETPYYLRQGLAHFANMFDAVLDRKPRVKMQTCPGVEEIEQYVVSKGCELVESSVNSAVLLQNSQAIISSGISSVVAEAAALGMPVLCIEDGVHPRAEQERYFGRIPNVTILPPEQAGFWMEKIGNEPASARPQSSVMRFDFDRTFHVMFE